MAIIGNGNEAHIIQDDDPITYTEAIQRTDKWYEAMKSEMDFG